MTGKHPHTIDKGFDVGSLTCPFHFFSNDYSELPMKMHFGVLNTNKVTGFHCVTAKNLSDAKIDISLRENLFESTLK